jgi:NAD(P)-dependent dehydrogenase (short-subunit alcohol dehydrogenase family)
MGQLTGQVAFVTGAARGQGRSHALRLAEEGADIIAVDICHDIDSAYVSMGTAAGLAQTVEPVEATDHQILARQADVRDQAPELDHPTKEDALEVFRTMQILPIDYLEPVDVSNTIVYLASDAGRYVTGQAFAIDGGRYIPFLEITDHDWDENLAINQTGAFVCCQEAARIMLAKPVDNRVILLVSSIRAAGVRPNVALYGITKAALNQLARQAAYELAPHGIRVNVLSPGLTVAPLVMQHTPEVYDKAKSGIPMARPGSPEDMAHAAAYLCSPAAAFVTGANLVVDGGESLW